MSGQPNKSPKTRRDSATSSSGSPFRQRRSSLSIAQPPSPSLPLSAAASINASMRGGSPGPASTAKDSAASRRSSVVAELALSDDRLPPPAEIAVGDRKGSLADNNSGSNASSANRIPSLSTQGSLAGASSANPFSSSGSHNGSPIDPFKSGALRDPLSGSTVDGPRGHHRTPSISQVHQEMEQEQEAQVNRLLITIHQQQQQIESLQRQLEGTPGIPSGQLSGPMSTLHDSVSSTDHAPGHSFLGVGGAAADFPPPPTPQRAHSSSSAGTTVASNMPAGKPSPTASPANLSGKVAAMQMNFPHRPSHSRGSSRAASPSPRFANKSSSLEGDGTRHWQTEATNLGTENEMLKQRIKELETQLREAKNDGSRMNVD